MNPHLNLISEDKIEALALGESVQVRVHGVSMLPWVRHGDAVCIQPVTRRLVPGDIALFQRDPTHPILHRVVRVHQDGEQLIYDCRGDSEQGDLESVPASAVIGVAETTSFRRWVYRWVHPPRRFINRLCSRMGIRLRHG